MLGEAKQRLGVAARATVLVVDDEDHFLFSIALALRIGGYDAKAVGDAESAFEEIRAAEKRGKPFSLLITDIQMPGASGVDLMDRLAAADLHIPTLVVTGFLDEQLREKLQARGCSDCLEKPLTPDELVQGVEAMMGRTDDV